MAVASKVGKDRRGTITYVNDEQGLAVVSPGAYEKYKNSNILDFVPIVEPSGRMIADDLPIIAEAYKKAQTT